MSRIRADQLVNRAGSGGPKFPNGVAEGFSVSGVVTATSFTGNLTGTVTGNADSATTATNAQGLTGTPNITVGTITGTDATLSGNLTVNGTTTTIDTAVTSVDSLSLDGNITIGSTVHAPDFTDGGSAKAITIGTTGDALLVTHSSGQGLGYFGYEAGGDRLVVACDGGSGTNKIDFITDAGTTSGGSTDNLNGKVPKMRITADGDVSVNTTVNGSNAKFEVKSTTGSINSATSRINGGGTSTGAINTGASLLLAGHDGVNGRDFASLFAGKENGTPGNHDAYLAFGTRVNSGSVTEKLRITSAGHILPGADNTQDLGSSAKRFANIYTGDLNLSNEGSANDVDGTWGQYTIQEGEDDLFLINRRTGKKYKFNLTEVD